MQAGITELKKIVKINVVNINVGKNLQINYFP